MKKAKQIGWFGWTLISVVLITIIGSVLFFFNVLDVDLKALVKGDNTPLSSEEKDESAVTEEMKENVEKVQETVGQEYQDIGKFVSEMHRFYNKTTGYGAIRSLDWSEQIKQAEYISEKIEAYMPSVKNKALHTDLKYIQDLTGQVREKEQSEDIRDLHRMFHDLDIALNSYNGYDRIWNVTQTLKEKY